MTFPRLLRAILGALLVVTLANVAPQQAAADAELLDVDVTSLATPVLNLADPAQVISLSGTLTNTSTLPVSNPTVQLWHYSQPIRSLEQLRALE
ncbi:hypothetical protein, partial [Escherichia coli]|uniref:hypothetical protein n=1 Tax=Escherichia coli TaxID=562 RepID=UPI00128FD324